MSNNEPSRYKTALRATWEIESLSSIIKNGLLDQEDHVAIKGLAIRIHQLNSVIMSALDDMGESNDELVERAGYCKG